MKLIFLHFPGFLSLSFSNTRLTDVKTNCKKKQFFFSKLKIFLFSKENLNYGFALKNRNTQIDNLLMIKIKKKKQLT